ncbi:MAG: hypothetical protein GY865_17975 [candidate division Zixibacteria bacterium]|nr:hypothetical protein [candidate division Zixibacteria bacterium]
MRYCRHILTLLLVGFIVVFAGFGCERDEIIVEPTCGGNYLWVEEYTGLKMPEPAIIVDSGYLPGKMANVKSVSDDDPIQMKSILIMDMFRLIFQVNIYRNDTTLVNQYKGHCMLNGDTIQFNIGDTIIQDYGIEIYNSDSIFIYDFNWPDSNGVTFINIPHDYILWWEFALKTEGVFIRQEIKE